MKEREWFMLIKLGGDEMEIFRNFLFYSFVGFGLEIAYAYLTGGRRDRKRTLLLPLCPVYGIGAAAVLFLSPIAEGNKIGIFFLGGATATVVEYILAVWYEKGLGVSFWDYRGVKGNLHGRVCLPFSAVWGILSLGLVYWVHPVVGATLRISAPVTVVWMILVMGDLVISGVMIRVSGDRDCLRWYDRWYVRSGQNREE